MVQPRFTADFPAAVVREGANEPTLPGEEEGMLRTFIDTASVGDSRWERPLVDENWHASCQAIYKGVVGADWGFCATSMQSCTKRSTFKKPGVSEKAKALWSMRDAKANGRASHDRSCGRHAGWREGFRTKMTRALCEAVPHNNNGKPWKSVNSTPHTSHFSQCCTTNDTHTRGSSRKFGVRT